MLRDGDQAIPVVCLVMCVFVKGMGGMGVVYVRDGEGCM